MVASNDKFELSEFFVGLSLFDDRIGAGVKIKIVAHLQLEQSTNSVKCLDQPNECLRVSVHLNWHFASCSENSAL